MHLLAVGCASEMRETRTADETAGGLVRVIDGREQTPLGLTDVDRVVVQLFDHGALSHEVNERRACSDRGVREIEYREKAIEHEQVRVAADGDRASITATDLDE